MTVNTDQIQSLYDATVVDSGGDKVGGVGQVYLDDQSGQPSWVTVKTGMFGTKETFVPLQDAKISGDQIHVPYSKDVIKDAPTIDGESHLDDADQSNLFSYYNIGDRPTDDPLGGREPAPETETTDAGVYGGRNADLAAGTRSADLGTDDLVATGTPDTGRTASTQAPATSGGEQQSRPEPAPAVEGQHDQSLGSERITPGGLRIRRHIVTEQQTITVPVQREEIEVVDEAGDQVQQPVQQDLAAGRHADGNGNA